MGIIIPTLRDDAGLRRLQETNAARAAGMVVPVAPTPPVEERGADPVSALTPRRAAAEERRGGDRRRDQRRRAHQPVLLDTRHKRERRRLDRRQGDTAAPVPAAAGAAAGIDIFV